MVGRKSSWLWALLILFAFLAVLTKEPVQPAWGQSGCAVKDSTQVQVDRNLRTLLAIGGYTKVGGHYRLALVDRTGAWRDALWDTIRVDTIGTLATVDTLPLPESDSYSDGLTITAYNYDIAFKTLNMETWGYLSQGSSVHLPVRLRDPDTLFVKKISSLPDVQVMRGKVKLQ